MWFPARVANSALRGKKPGEQPWPQADTWERRRPPASGAPPPLAMAGPDAPWRGLPGRPDGMVSVFAFQESRPLS